MAEKLLKIVLGSSFDATGFDQLKGAIEKASKESKRTQTLGGGGFGGSLEDIRSRFGKNSMLGEVADIFQGKGAIGGLGDWARNIRDAASAFKGFTADMASGKSAAEALSNAIGRIPIIGDAWQFGKELKDAFNDSRVIAVANSLSPSSSNLYKMRNGSDATAIAAAQEQLAINDRINAGRTTFAKMQQDTAFDNRLSLATSDYERQSLTLKRDAQQKRDAARAAAQAGEISESSLEKVLDGINQSLINQIRILNRETAQRQVDTIEAWKSGTEAAASANNIEAPIPFRSAAAAQSFAGKQLIDARVNQTRDAVDAARLGLLGFQGDRVGSQLESVRQRYDRQIRDANNPALAAALGGLRDAEIARIRGGAYQVGGVTPGGFSSIGEITGRFRGVGASFDTERQQQQITLYTAYQRSLDMLNRTFEKALRVLEDVLAALKTERDATVIVGT